MEGRLKKLIDYLEDNKNPELTRISIFQLGELARETPDIVISAVCPLLQHRSLEVTRAASVALTEILAKTPFACTTAQAVWTLSGLLTEQKPYKKHCSELTGFEYYFDLWRELLVWGEWEDKLKAAFGLLPVAQHAQLCSRCAEDLVSRCLFVIAHDQVADYSGDIPEYPLREVTSDIVKFRYSELQGELLKKVLLKFLAAAQPQGPLLVIRKCKLRDEELYSELKQCLGKQEDIITEACRCLLDYESQEDQALCDEVCRILVEFDDLSSCLKYAIQLFNRIIKTGCSVSIDISQLFPLFFHKLTDVRVAFYNSLVELVGNCSFYIDVFHLVLQGLLFETDEHILNSAFVLVRSVAGYTTVQEYFASVWKALSQLVSAPEVTDYSFIRVYGEETGPEAAYLFCDYDYPGDVKSKSYIEFKHFLRIKNLRRVYECITVGNDLRVARHPQGYKYFLGILIGAFDSELMRVFEYSDNDGMLEIRVKAAACIRLSKLLKQGKIALPEKITPVIQTLVTSYNNETVEYLREKVAKAASEFTLLLLHRGCNDKILTNMMKKHVNPFAKHLQSVHQSSIFSKFLELQQMLTAPQEHPRVFNETTCCIHPSLHSVYAEQFPRYLALNLSAILPGMLNILNQVDSLIPVFTIQIIKQLEAFAAPQPALSLLLALLRSTPVKCIPYSICLTTKLLANLYNSNITKVLVAEIFGEVLQTVVLDNAQDVPECLRAHREQGLEFLGYLRQSYRLPEYVPCPAVNIHLRDYQREGVAWLLFLKKYGMGGMLCDEMGLGKTVQVLCAVIEAHSAAPGSKSLVVCPYSVIGHWLHETAQFFPSLKCCELSKRPQTHVDLIVASYRGLKSSIQSLSSVEFCYIVLDEGHLIQNTSSMIFKTVKRLRGKFKAILTGTPIQNRVLEIWPFFDFLMPGFLSTEQHFTTEYRKDLAPKKVSKTVIRFSDEHKALQKLNNLHKKILPFILRRLKKNVSDIPEKIVQDYYVSLTPTQETLLADFRAAKQPSSSFVELTFLRKLCNHPALVDASIPPSLKASPKLKALRDLLINCEVVEEAGSSYKAIIFCQMNKMIDIIQNSLELEFPNTQLLRIDGHTHYSVRQDIVNSFTADSAVRVILLNTKAAGLGLNLQVASVVIFIDHDWNPVVDLQAMDRAHRIGQKNVVNVYRLVTKDTLEESILGLQAFKTKISEILVNSDNASMQNIDTTWILANYHSI